jgi:hypothetical protein
VIEAADATLGRAYSGDRVDVLSHPVDVVAEQQNSSYKSHCASLRLVRVSTTVDAPCQQCLIKIIQNRNKASM